MASAAADRKSNVTATADPDPHKEDPAKLRSISDLPGTHLVQRGCARLPVVLAVRQRSRCEHSSE